jgi:hypothetical protein
VLAAALLLAAVLAATPLLDQRAAQTYEGLFQRALVTFALARTLNGVISAVQGTEVALQPAGVGVTLTPGEVLDPVNDLVERFSWIMLGATVSLGVQQVLLEISAWWALRGLVVVLALWLALLHFRRPPAGQGAAGGGRGLLWRLLLMALFLRFAVPLTLVANEAIYELFLEARYEESSEVISNAGQALEQLQEEQLEAAREGETVSDASVLGAILGTVGEAWDDATAGLDLGQKVDRIQQRAAELLEHVIQLSVVFVLQTGLLPIVFLWLFLRLGQWLLRVPPK